MPPASPDQLRMMLMHFGGHITMVMAMNNLTPEQVAAASNGYITQDELIKIMTGSLTDVPVSKLAYVAGQLKVPFGVGIHASAFQPMPPVAGPASPAVVAPQTHHIVPPLVAHPSTAPAMPHIIMNSEAAPAQTPAAH